MNPASIPVSNGELPSCCHLCKPINLHTIIKTGINLPLKPYLTTWKNRLDSENPCGLCTLILSSFSSKNRLMNADTLFLRFNKHHEAIVVVASTVGFINNSIHLDLLCGPSGNHWLVDETTDRPELTCGFLRVNCGFGKEEHKSGAFKHRIASTSSGSDECLDLAERWLEECCKSHLRKCQIVNTDFIPTRLIDVGREPKRDSVKLVSLQKSDHLNDSTPIKYAALSYCWGTTPFLITTSLNFKDMYNSIPLSRLPATIRDAIKIVRLLKIQYLWTDSLCILQGSDEAARKDWLAESSQMGQIYESAHFTISAESAPSAVTGILHHRPTESVDFFPIPASINNLDVVYLGSFQTRGPKRTEPLHFRGWTLQETILSPRLLRFGTREISWRCRTGQKWETRCHEEERTDQFKHHDNGIKEMYIKDKIAHDIYSKWWSTVEDYSRRTLTKSSDKLPAIAGLAKVAQRTSSDVYAAGIWIGDVSHGLLWMHERKKQAYVRKDEFQAPTWSWASVEGPIRHLHGYIPVKRLAIEFQSREFHAAEACSNKYKLVIRGLVKQLSTVRCHEFGAYYGGYDNFIPWMSLPSSLETYLDDLNNIPLKYKKGGMEHPIELVNTSFLILAKERDEPLAAGLIIIPVGQIPTYFRRIGMFKGLPLTKVEAEELDAESLKIVRIARALYRERKFPIPVTTITLI